MNLLLILFIILFASSQLDKAKADQVAKSVREGFGYSENGGTGSGGPGTGLIGNALFGVSPSADGESGNGIDAYWSQLRTKETFESFYNEVVHLIQNNNLQTAVDVTLDDTGVVISFKDNALFPSGSAELNTASMKLIDNIGSLLKGLNFSYILIEGHTDSDPIHTAQYKDNMDLSTQRASNVWRELASSGLPPDRMSPIGYGEFKPAADNNTSENKAKNRRVVVTIMHNQITSSSEIVMNAGGTASEIAIHPSPSPSGAAGHAPPSTSGTAGHAPPSPSGTAGHAKPSTSGTAVQPSPKASAPPAKSSPSPQPLREESLTS